MKLPPLNLFSTTCANGLRVLVLETHHLPIVTSTIWYAVGSAHEPRGQTGISHFVEHLLFKGTPTYPKGMVDWVTTAYGGDNNAGTIYDYTMYYFHFATPRWETALDIEADRMRHCLFDEEEVEAERQVILEELHQTEDSPWGPLSTDLEALMFPDGHPYHHTPIGLGEDLERISRDDLLAHYRSWYMPNNATIVIVGDVRASDVIRKVEKVFGAIPTATPVSAPQFPPIRQKLEQRLELLQDTNLKRVHIGYHTTPLAHPDHYALDVIDHILSHGKTSRLHQRLIEQEQLVTFADAYHHPRQAAGVFHMFAELPPGGGAERVEGVLHEEIDRLKMETVSDAELLKIQRIIAADAIFDRETTNGLAHTIGEYAMLDAPDYVNSYVANIQAVTPDDITRVAETYLRPEFRTVGWGLPENPEMERTTIVVPDKPSAPLPSDMVFHTSTDPKPSGSSSFSGEKAIEAHRPPAAIPPISTALRWVLDNGLTVLYLEHAHLPVVAVEAFVHAGQLYEVESKAGVAALTGRLLDEGTRHRSAFEIAESIESMGGALHTKSRGAAVQVLAEHLAEALDVLADVLRFPKFEQQQIEKERGRMLAMLESDADAPSVVGYHAFNEMVYGTHPYHRPSKGYTETVSALKREDILDYYTTYFVPNNTTVAIVGAVAADDVLDLITRYFGGWASQALPPQRELQIPTSNGSIVRSIPRKKAQTHVYLGHAGMTRMNPDFYTALVLEHVLGTGPGFTDRISRKLRDEQGLAYTVYANLTMTAEEEPGTFMAYIGTSPEHTATAIEGVLREMRELQNVLVPPNELDVAKEYLIGSYLFSFETTTQLARYLIEAERFHLGQDFLEQYPRKIRAVTSSDVMQAAQLYLDPENYYVAIVGASDTP